MIIAYEVRDGVAREVPFVVGATQDGLVWLDLVNPTPEERDAVEKVLGVRAPLRDQMHYLEMRNRFYLAQGALYMLVEVAADPSATRQETHSVALILTRKHLVTVRFAELAPFSLFRSQSLANAAMLASNQAAFLNIVQTITDHAGLLLRGIVGEMDSIAKIIFWDPLAQEDRFVAKKLGTRSALYGISKAGDMVSSAQRSLVSIDRLLAFYRECMKPKQGSNLAVRIHMIQRDVKSLNEHVGFLTQKLSFLMDATTGLITAEQNQIIKIFSVAAVIFLPPTLVASVYGMNFLNMPELSWTYGYGFALLLMVVMAVVPYAFFRYKRWI